MKAQAGTGKSRYRKRSSVLFCFPIHHTGKAMENLCQFCDPAGLKGDVLPQKKKGTLVSET